MGAGVGIGVGVTLGVPIGDGDNDGVAESVAVGVAGYGGIVRTITPESPTAQTLAAFTTDTSKRLFVVPLI